MKMFEITVAISGDDINNIVMFQPDEDGLVQMITLSKQQVDIVASELTALASDTE